VDEFPVSQGEIRAKAPALDGGRAFQEFDLGREIGIDEDLADEGRCVKDRKTKITRFVHDRAEKRMGHDPFGDGGALIRTETTSQIADGRSRDVQSFSEIGQASVLAKPGFLGMHLDSR